MTGTSKWSDTANSDPLSDIKSARDKVEEKTGTRPGITIMSRKTFNYLLSNSNIKSAILAQNMTANIFMTDALLKAFIKGILDVSIIIYTKKYKDESGTTKNFYPDDMCALVPDATLGSTWFSATPEERSGAASEIKVAIVNTGIAVAVSRTTTASLNTQTTASDIVLPSFERMDECYILKVN